MGSNEYFPKKKQNKNLSHINCDPPLNKIISIDVMYLAFILPWALLNLFAEVLNLLLPSWWAPIFFLHLVSIITPKCSVLFSRDIVANFHYYTISQKTFQLEKCLFFAKRNNLKLNLVTKTFCKIGLGNASSSYWDQFETYESCQFVKNI